MDLIKKYKWLILLLLVVVMGLLIGYFNSRGAQKYTTQKVTRGAIFEAVYGIGTVTANKSYLLKIPIASNVRDVFVREGDNVKSGQSLIKLEEVPIFHAPFSGTITEINYKIGETVTPQSTILNLLDMKDRYLLVALEQQGAVKVQRGQNARLSFEGMRDKPFNGKVEATYVKENQFTVRISGENLPDQLLPGMTVDVAIEISKKNDVLLAPVAAVAKGSVTILKGNSKKIIPVKTGLIDGSTVEIISEQIKVDDELIIGVETK